MMSREKIAHNYLIFRYPTEYLLIIFPTLIGILVNIFTSPVSNTSQQSGNTLVNLQYEAITNYLITSKITIVILIAFFICYRWANMLNDGSYGFWLTAGIVRRAFFFRVILKFTAIVFIAQTLGVITLIYINSIYIEINLFLRLLGSILVHILFIVILAVYLSNRLRNPEFASILYLTFMGFNLGFNQDPNSIMYSIFQNDLAYLSQNYIFGMGVTALMSFVLAVLALRAHLKQDIDI